MPYARRRKTGVAKRRYVRKGSPKVSKATKTYVKKALTANKETNYLQVDSGSTGISYDTPLLVHLSAIAQGAGTSLRDGDRIQPIKLEYRFQVVHSAITEISRVILFQWKPDTAIEVPTLAKLLEVSGTNFSVYSPYVQDSVERAKFQVLKDYTFTGAGVATTAPTFWRSIKVSKFLNKFINYNDGATTGKSQLYIIGFSNLASASVEPVFNRLATLHWKDTA